MKIIYKFALLFAFSAMTASAEEADPRYELTISQNGSEIGKMVLELYPQKAPLHCRNFDSLVSIGFYDGTAFHRVIPGFMIQGGDPNSKNKPKDTWGYGDPSQTKVNAEFNTGIKHTPGVLSAARTTDPHSATSQFFICQVNLPSLDGQYSTYGKAISGTELISTIANTPRDSKDNPISKVEMKIVKLDISSIEDSESKAYKSYASDNSFVFEFASDEMKEVQIYDALGNKINAITSFNTFLEINTENLIAGIYFARVSTNGKSYMSKFIR